VHKMIMALSLVSPELGASIIDAVESPMFGNVLLKAAQDLAIIDEVFAFHAKHNAAPVIMASSSKMDDAGERADIYSRRFYRFDPAAYDRAMTPIGKGVASTVHASQIDVREYRAICFDKPAIVTKYCYGWNAADAWYVMNFYARADNDSTALGLLSQLASLGLSAMVRARQRVNDQSPDLADLEQRLLKRVPELTVREREVCARTLLGLSAAEIAVDLEISRHSVLTYRQRAYRRCGLTSANGLLARLLY
jgi:DNA-binding CsgD family transcriptional regulator